MAALIAVRLPKNLAALAAADMEQLEDDDETSTPHHIDLELDQIE